MTIDPRNNWALAEERLDGETDPTLRRNLEVVIRHMKAEAAGDLDALLATVAEGARYHFFGSEDDELFAGPKGKDNVATFYRTVLEMGIHRIEHAIDRIVVDRDCVTTEGEIRIAYPGGLLQGMGIDVDDPEGLYLYQTRQLIVWPIDGEGLITGEDSYTGKDGFEGIADRKIDPADIVAVT